MNKFIKNKKGDIGVTLLVVLVFILAVAALVVFNGGLGVISDTMTDLSFVDVVSSERVYVESFLNQVAEEAFIDSYKEFVEKGSYIKGPVSSTDHTSYLQFSLIFEDEQLRKKFRDLFEKKFLEGMKGKKIFGQDFKDEDFKFDASKDWVEVRTSALEVVSGKEGISVDYSSEYVDVLEFKDFGLHSFSELSDVRKTCFGEIKSEEVGKSEECLKVLDNFKSDVTYDAKGFFLVKFESEREFIRKVGSDVKKEKISFGFVIK